MRVERSVYKENRSNSACLRTSLGCGLLLALSCALMSLGFLAFLPRLPELLLRVSGFESVGQTSTYIASAPTPLPLPPLSNPQPVASRLSLNTGSGTQAINLGDTGVRISRAQANGAPVIQISASEADLRRAYQQLITPQLRRDPSLAWIDLDSLAVDLYNGGLIVRGDLNVPQVGIRQNLGIVLQFTPENQLRLVGLDVNGTLLTPSLAENASQANITELVREVEQALNQGLRQMSVTIGGQAYSLWRMSANSETLTLLLR
ncbi:MAG: hypothetical protein NZ750_12820 [Anaerolineae bacterium]|nr:hypothetical protein [Anaerolineae bacterium]MDW8173658.1 hypothetical protein [Anaerolineae bacterium]